MLFTFIIFRDWYISWKIPFSCEKKIAAKYSLNLWTNLINKLLKIVDNISTTSRAQYIYNTLAWLDLLSTSEIDISAKSISNNN